MVVAVVMLLLLMGVAMRLFFVKVFFSRVMLLSISGFMRLVLRLLVFF